MPAFTGGDAAAAFEASLLPPGPASKMYGSGELIDFAPQINIDYAEIFDFDPGPISGPAATADVAQIAFAAASTNLSSAGRNSRSQIIGSLDLLANGLGPTHSAKRGRFLSSGGGLDSGILGVFLLILITVLVALAVLRWKLP
jgi:hypothetical protein